MLHLPPQGHSARTWITDDMIRDLTGPAASVARATPLFRHALSEARARIAADPAVSFMAVLALRANDDIVLMRVGPRGGQRCLWNFSTGRARY